MSGELNGELGWRARARSLRLDFCLIGLAALFSAPTLAYPYGRDQGLFHYVGREWFRHGRLPFRDLVEHRPPIFHVVYGVGALLFGDQTWFVRLFDLALTIALGLAAACLVTPRGQAIPRGLWGMAAAYACIQHFGFFNFWHTAQIDFLATCIGFFGIAAVHRAPSARSAEALGGFLAGLAVTIKPSAIWLTLVAVGLLFARTAPTSIRRRAGALLRFALCGSIAPLTLAAYFGAQAALDDLFLWVVRVNGYYAKHERTVSSASEIASAIGAAFHSLDPFATLLSAASLVSFGVALRSRNAGARNRLLLIGALFAAVWLGIAMQLKFYRYHVAALVAPMTALAAALLQDLRATFRRHAPSRGGPLADGFALLLFGVLFVTAPGTRLYRQTYAASLDYFAGGLPRSLFLRRFTGKDFDAAVNESVGLWLRDHSQPGDDVAVRGFEPSIYVSARRACRARFFWTNFITDRRRSLLHDAWLLEIDQDVRRHPPRFVVTLGIAGEVVGNAWHMERAPYVERAAFGVFRILELREVPLSKGEQQESSLP